MEDAKSILEQGIERWNAHDRAGFLALFDDKAVFVDEPTGQQFKGPEEIGTGFYDVETEAYPDNQIKEPFVFGEKDLVGFYGSFTGTNTGPFHGLVELPASGKHVESPFAFIAEFHEGKVKSARIYYDRLTNLEQQGFVSLEEFAARLPVA